MTQETIRARGPGRRARRIAAAIDPGRAADLRHRRRARQRQPRRRLARRRPGGRDPRACCSSTACCSSATRTSPAAEHVAFARHFGELEDHPVAGSDPEHPGLVRIYKSPDTPNDRYENAWHTDATWREKPPFGCVLRCVECPPVGGDTMWANMVLAYEKLPEHVKATIAGLRARHSIEASFGAAMPIEKRLALQGAVPGRRAPGGAHAPRDGREDPLRQRLHDALHQLPHAGERALRPGLRARRERSCCSYLVSQAFIPEYQVRFRWKPNSMAMWDNRSHPALRRHGLPAVPSKDGARRHHRRHAVLTALSRLPTTSTKDTTMNFLDGSLFPENQDKLVITAAPYGPEWMPSDFPEDIPVTMEAAGPEGGGLLQRRRHRAAPARARTRRQGQQAPVQVQRADRRRAQGACPT